MTKLRAAQLAKIYDLGWNEARDADGSESIFGLTYEDGDKQDAYDHGRSDRLDGRARRIGSARGATGDAL